MAPKSPPNRWKLRLRVYHSLSTDWAGLLLIGHELLRGKARLAWLGRVREKHTRMVHTLVIGSNPGRNKSSMSVAKNIHARPMELPCFLIRP